MTNDEYDFDAVPLRTDYPQNVSKPDQPVFTCVEQALHVSYLIEHLPPSGRSPMGLLYEKFMKANGVWDEPRNRETRVNFGGLNAQEVRGQCAQVIVKVQRLMWDEIHTIEAFYGHGPRKVMGMQGVCSYAEPFLSDAARACSQAPGALAIGIFGNDKERTDNSLRNIARTLCLSSSTLGRDQVAMRNLALRVLTAAVKKLQVPFEACGLIGATYE